LTLLRRARQREYQAFSELEPVELGEHSGTGLLVQQGR